MVGRQDRRRKADALAAFAGAVAHPWTAHRDRTDAGHDFALGQMPVAHQPLAAIIGELVGMAAEQGGKPIGDVAPLAKALQAALGGGVSLASPGAAGPARLAPCRASTAAA